MVRNLHSVFTSVDDMKGADMRLIDTDALELRVDKFERLTGMKLDIVHDFITSAPTIDAVSVVHGEWIDKSGGIEGAWNYCSVCGEQAIDLYDFCPNCGADMKGNKNEQTD